MAQGSARAAEASFDTPPSTDWTLRPFEHAVPPLWVGALLVLAFTGVTQLFRVATGDSLHFWRGGYLWLDLLNGLLFAYAPTATYMLRRARLGDLRQLRPALLGNDVDFERLEGEVVRAAPSLLFRCGLVWGLLGASFPILDPSFWHPLRPALMSPEMIFFALRTGATGWLIGHAVAHEWVGLRGLNRIGATRVRVDLLDLEPLTPFARSGQRSAFAWVMVSSLLSLFWLGPFAGLLNLVLVISILLSVTVGFYASIEGVHRSIRAAKREALGAVNERIRERTTALFGAADAPVRESLAEWVAFHGFIERIREWPLDTPVVLRGMGIAAVAAGSWLGGALVERLLERTLQ